MMISRSIFSLYKFDIAIDGIDRTMNHIERSISMVSTEIRCFSVKKPQSVIRISFAPQADAHHRDAVSCRFRNRRRSS
jgi:hypothetical protein